MNKNKLKYEVPETETLIVRFEGNLCTSPGYGDSGHAGGDPGDGDELDV